MVNNVDQIRDLLFRDIKEESEFYRKKPLLAHYTSLDSLEKILESNEILFSNPLFMNDHTELKRGMHPIIPRFARSKAILDALGNEKRRDLYIKSLDRFYEIFDQKLAFDTYIFCMSEHDLEENADGVLSMWRGYGGDGSGAAIVFDMGKINLNPTSPIIISEVQYINDAELEDWFAKVEKIFSGFISITDVSDDEIEVLTFMLYKRLQICALFTKHHGFKEEKEWRAVFLSDMEYANVLKEKFSYINVDGVVQPKLKFPFEYIKDVTSEDFSLEKILHSILLGPTSSSRLALDSVKRMLEVMGKKELSMRINASSIPYRSKK